MGYENTFIGYNSGTATVSGWKNVCVGNESGNGNVNGNGNTFVGWKAGGLCGSTANSNTAIGLFAGYSVTNIRNTFLEILVDIILQVVKEMSFSEDVVVILVFLAHLMFL